MPQGKMKQKMKLPLGVSLKKKPKGKPVTAQKCAPMPQKNIQNRNVKKMKKAITKTVNAAAEEELRALAFDTKRAIANNTSSLKKKSSSN